MTLFNKTALSAAMSVAFLSLSGFANAETTGPSTETTPYLISSASGIEFTSILAVGDEVKKKHKGNETYRMVGIPDGLGAYDNGDGTITVLMNQELGSTLGAVRAHGEKGAFVSKWQIRKSDLKVLNGEDLIETVKMWNGTEYVDTPAVAFSRFCSADLAAPTAFFNSNTGKGFNEGRIFLNGEESGPAGRAFAHMALGRQHGTAYQLPALGTASWENIVASPLEQDMTIVAGLDDGDRLASKLYFYVGQKQEEGNPIEMAGLIGGTNYQVKIADFVTEASVPYSYTGAFTMVPSNGTGLNRVEDGAWDTKNPSRFFFVTTDRFDNTATGGTTVGNSRLWSVTFSDMSHPELGGEIKVLVDGKLTGVQMMDNMTVDADGYVWIQEDVGNNAHLGKVWKFDPNSPGAVPSQVAAHDAARFLGVNALTQDEESSGIVEVSDLFKGVDGYDTDNNRYFLLDVQAHYKINSTIPRGFENPNELVEGGQLLMMKAPK